MSSPLTLQKKIIHESKIFEVVQNDRTSCSKTTSE
jgi:hypothetical protein